LYKHLPTMLHLRLPMRHALNAEAILRPKK
jgi:hypothetical protein